MVKWSPVIILEIRHNSWEIKRWIKRRKIQCHGCHQLNCINRSQKRTSWPIFQRRWKPRCSDGKNIVFPSCQQSWSKECQGHKQLPALHAKSFIAENFKNKERRTRRHRGWKWQISNKLQRKAPVFGLATLGNASPAAERPQPLNLSDLCSISFLNRQMPHRQYLCDIFFFPFQPLSRRLYINTHKCQNRYRWKGGN